MPQNAEGFYSPILDSNLCIKCNRCNLVCPSQQIIWENTKTPKAAVAIIKDETTRLKSSSGGVFSQLALQILAEGGQVCGAVISEGRVYHKLVDNKEDLTAIYGSKYVQSDLGDCFREIRKLLKAKTAVLFAGTPCQVAGLRLFLKKNHPLLLTVDLVCHGTPSPLVWEKYVQEEMEGEKLLSVNFRSKISGWTLFSLEMRSKKKLLIENLKYNTYMRGFLSELYSCQVCDSCPFTQLQRQGDVTLGDFWGVRLINKNWDDRKGTSLLLINSPKGESYIEKISAKLSLNESVSLEKVLRSYNAALKAPFHHHRNRKTFFNELKKQPNASVSNLIHKMLMEKKDIAILNLWWSKNYGAVLTAYAQQQYLAKLGYTSQLIHHPTHRGMHDVGEAFDSFITQHLKCSKFIEKARDLHEISSNYDTFMVGSDQVWNLRYTARAGYTYFLDFVPSNKKLISCAASFGKEECDRSNRGKEIVTSLLSRFDAISVREREGVNICRDLSITATQILDPVFFLPSSHYSELADSSDIELPEDYVAVHILDHSPEVQRVLSALGCAETAIEAGIRNGKKADIPSWLKTIRDARYFVTDSFHGACFGLLFNKPILIVPNMARGLSRFTSLVNAFGIAEHLITPGEEINKKLLTQRPFDSVDAQESLEQYIAFSQKFIKDALEKPLRKNPPQLREMLQQSRNGFFKTLTNKHLLRHVVKELYLAFRGDSEEKAQNKRRLWARFLSRLNLPQ